MGAQLLDLIAHATRDTGHAIAVDMPGHRLTYAELAVRSDAVARRLVARGIGHGAVVAVAVSRSPELVPVLLGVLKAGAAYVPIDPSLPADRQTYMATDAGAAITIADTGWDWRSDPPASIPAARAPAAGDLAYVIYTSGSTGLPKGVEIAHGAVANFVRAMQRTPGLSAADRVLAHTTVSFDLHVLELWGALSVGATIVLVDRDTATDPLALAHRIAASHASVVQATPAMWSLLLRAGWRDGRGVKALCGGEALPRDLADALLATGVDLWNMYGPTETTVWSSLWRVTPAGPILIGDPIDGGTLHVVDDRLAEVGAGSTGELCIGGAGLARGYRSRPELTAERFVTLPAPDGRRVYRTGDLARRHADGGVECLGRLDHQVKVGGNRVEPGEVEAALRRLPGIRDAVVVARDGAQGLRQLVAYLVVHDGRPAGSELRRGLASSLPDYMIPSQFVTLDALPLTANGKIDRAALPSPVPDADQAPRPAAEAETPTQHAVLAIWREAFARDGIGVDDDFFDLGGHSRLGAYVFALIADRLGSRLPLTRLVDAPTVRRLAAAIDDEAPRLPLDPEPLIALQPRPAKDAPVLFLVHAAGGHAVIYRDLARQLAGDIGVVVFQSRGLDGQAPPRRSVTEMAAAYITELHRVQPAGPYAIGGASFGGVVAWEMARQLRQRGDVVGLLVLMDTGFPPLAGSRSVRILTRLPGFVGTIYPRVRRGLSHARALRRLGWRRYGAWLQRDRREARRIGEARLAQQVGDAGLSLLDGLSRVRTANEVALANYVPRQYEGAVCFCRARDGRDEDDTRDWWRAVAPRIVYHELPGNHGTMLLEPQVRATADVLRAALLTPDTSTASAATPLPPPPHRSHRVPA